MSDDSLSSEAVVASQAAAQAVEELHEREEVAQDAATASVEADVALSAASDAVELAQTSVGVSEAAAESAYVAQDEAAQAQETAEAAVSVTLTVAEQLEELRQRQEAGFSDLRAYVDSRLPVEPAVNAIEEVEVNDRSGNPDNSGTGTGEGSDEETGSPGSAAQKRRQLRHRSR